MVLICIKSSFNFAQVPICTHLHTFALAPTHTHKNALSIKATPSTREGGMIKGKNHKIFLDAFSHLCMRVHPAVRPPVRLSVRLNGLNESWNVILVCILGSQDIVISKSMDNLWRQYANYVLSSSSDENTSIVFFVINYLQSFGIRNRFGDV